MQHAFTFSFIKTTLTFLKPFNPFPSYLNLLLAAWYSYLTAEEQPCRYLCVLHNNVSSLIFTCCRIFSKVCIKKRWSILLHASRLTTIRQLVHYLSVVKFELGSHIHYFRSVQHATWKLRATYSVPVFINSQGSTLCYLCRKMMIILDLNVLVLSLFDSSNVLYFTFNSALSVSHLTILVIEM